MDENKKESKWRGEVTRVPINILFTIPVTILVSIFINSYSFNNQAWIALDFDRSSVNFSPCTDGGEQGTRIIIQPYFTNTGHALAEKISTKSFSVLVNTDEGGDFLSADLSSLEEIYNDELIQAIPPQQSFSLFTQDICIANSALSKTKTFSFFEFNYSDRRLVRLRTQQQRHLYRTIGDQSKGKTLLGPLPLTDTKKLCMQIEQNKNNSTTTKMFFESIACKRLISTNGK